MSACSACLLVLFGLVQVGSAQAAVEHAPANIQLPAISGTAKAGGTLTASIGSWTEEPTAFSYRWETCYPSGGCLVRQESTIASYVVQGVDAGRQIKVTVTASNAFGAGSASAMPVSVELSWHFGTGPPRLVRTSFSASREEPPWSTSRVLSVGVNSGICVGEGRPYLSEVHVHERGPTSKLAFPSVVLTTSVLFPAPTEIVGTVNPGEPGPGCAGIGIGLGRRVRLGRPSARLYVYDGSQDPPRLVLEPAKILHWRKLRIVGPRSIEISVPFAGCAGMSISVHAVYRPGRAIVTAYGERPDVRRPRPCQKSYGVEQVGFKLDKPVNSVELLDGSFAPPRPRLP